MAHYITHNNEIILSLGSTAEEAWAECIKDANPYRMTGDGPGDETFATVDDDPADFGIRIVPATADLAEAITTYGGAICWDVNGGVADVPADDDA